mmetsp:Transcript_26039/g.31949  ORF Transcript_26039/g.31949 Transcript_26039/m.31949 type:complete len:82 (+) Transcript_26039:1058-1303(+)
MPYDTTPRTHTLACQANEFGRRKGGRKKQEEFILILSLVRENAVARTFLCVILSGNENIHQSNLREKRTQWLTTFLFNLTE